MPTGATQYLTVRLPVRLELRPLESPHARALSPFALLSRHSAVPPICSPPGVIANPANADPGRVETLLP
jgi:hypothetical protein